MRSATTVDRANVPALIEIGIRAKPATARV
jgi:hypothetical protein